MSISLSVGANGATTGRTDQTIAGDGEIDTRAEAEAALAFLPENSTNTVKVGNREYTRAQLIEIRDRAPAAPAADAGTDVSGTSHGVALDGFGFGGLGQNGHNGGGVTLRYVAGVPLLTRDWRIFLDPTVGFRLSHGSMDYRTPGGEGANSAFTSYGLTGGADLRFVPPVWDHRLGFGVGLRGSVSGFNTPDGTTVQTPTNCTPGDFGRADCEPGAGPRTGNAGTTGLFNPRVGNSRGTGGVALDLDIPVTVSADIARGSWGNVALYAQFIPGLTSLMPSDGDGFSFWRMGGGLGIMGRFGGSAVERPRREEVTGPNVVNTPDAAVAQGEGYSVAAPEGGWRNGDQVLLDGTALTDPAVPTSGNAAYVVPASRLATPGPHTIVVRYTRDGRVNERTTRLTVNEPVRASDAGTASANGFTLAQTLRVNRAPLVPGQPPAPLNIGSIVSEAGIPAGMKVEIRIDNERAGTPIDLVRDGRTQLTIPASIADGSHSVEFRIVDSSGAVRHRFVGQPIVIGPGTATLSAASVTSNPPSGGYYGRDGIRIRVTSDVAGPARVMIGNHAINVTLTAGVNDISLPGEPRSFDTGARAGTRQSFTVTIQPVDAAGALVGTRVDVGQVTIAKAGHHGGGGGNPAPTVPRPPRR